MVKNAAALAAGLTERGFRLVSGGTDNHLVLVDLRDSTLDGQQAEDLLHTAGITVNRNAVPFDPRPPRVTSGLRIGTPALATRGFGEAEFTEVADIIAATLVHGAAGTADDETLAALRGRVRALTRRLPPLPGAGPVRAPVERGGPGPGRQGHGRRPQGRAQGTRDGTARARRHPRPGHGPGGGGPRQRQVRRRQARRLRRGRHPLHP